MAKQQQSIGVRLAIRQEGNWLNAYLALEGTMDGARLIGSILRGIVENDNALWEQWKSVMTIAMKNGVKEAFGQTPDMIERPAPANEKAGNA